MTVACLDVNPCSVATTANRVVRCEAIDSVRRPLTAQSVQMKWDEWYKHSFKHQSGHWKMILLPWCERRRSSIPAWQNSKRLPRRMTDDLQYLQGHSLVRPTSLFRVRFFSAECDEILPRCERNYLGTLITVTQVRFFHSKLISR